MNRINPLYLGVLLVMVLFFVSYKLVDVKSQLVEVKSNYKDSLQIATKLSGLKKAYSKKSISSLRATSLVKKKTKTGIIITASSLNKKELNRVVGKLLNSTYNIKEFKIKRLDDTTASLRVEIKW